MGRSGLCHIKQGGSSPVSSWQSREDSEDTEDVFRALKHECSLTHTLRIPLLKTKKHMWSSLQIYSVVIPCRHTTDGILDVGDTELAKKTILVSVGLNAQKRNTSGGGKGPLLCNRHPQNSLA